MNRKEDNMAKGTQLKIDLGNKIIELFGEDNAFWNGEGKEIRINDAENGEPLQIKITFTVAKNAVEPGEADMVPGAKANLVMAVPNGNEPSFPEPAESEKVEVSEQEKNAVADLMRELGL